MADNLLNALRGEPYSPSAPDVECGEDHTDVLKEQLGAKALLGTEYAREAKIPKMNALRNKRQFASAEMHNNPLAVKPRPV